MRSFYIYGAVGVVILGLLLTVAWYRASLIELETQVKIAKEQAKQDSKEIIKEIEVEKKIYIDRIKVQKEYVYDENKTKCDNGMARIRITGL
jgi:hypothetical protein